MLSLPYPEPRNAVVLSFAEWSRGRAARAEVLRTIDALIRRDARSLRIEERLGREQRALRRLVTEEAWAQYLRVEAAHMDRTQRWLELAAKSRTGRRPRSSR